MQIGVAPANLQELADKGIQFKAEILHGKTLSIGFEDRPQIGLDFTQVNDDLGAAYFSTPKFYRNPNLSLGQEVCLAPPKAVQAPLPSDLVPDPYPYPFQCLICHTPEINSPKRKIQYLNKKQGRLEFERPCLVL